MTEPALFVDHLNFGYTQERILQNVSFQISPGEFVGIIGPNGGGKTTLLKLLMGFLKPQSGQIQLFGNSPKQARQTMAYMPQNLQFDRQFPITVWELVLGGCLRSTHWWGGYTTEAKKKAHAAIERVGLHGHLNRTFGTLSGGEAQRALLARALVSSPKILFLDEPTSNVDAEAEKQIHSLLRELIGSVTLLIVTHDLNAVVDRMDKVLCVQHEVSSLSPQEVCAHYAIGLYHSPTLLPPKRTS